MHETLTLARFVAESQWDEIPQAMRHEVTHRFAGSGTEAERAVGNDRIKAVLGVASLQAIDMRRDPFAQRQYSRRGLRRLIHLLHSALLPGGL